MQALGVGLHLILATGVASQVPAIGLARRPGAPVQTAKPDPGQLFVEAEALANTGDHAAAIERYRMAFELQEDAGEIQAMLNSVARLVHSSRELYRTEGNAERLQQAKQLLDRFIRGLDAVQGAVTDELKKSAMRDRDLLEEELSRIDVQPAPKPTPTVAAPEPASEKPVASPQQPASDGPSTSSLPNDTRTRPQPRRGLLIGGGISVGLAAGATGLMTVGLVRGAGAEQAGRDRVDEADGLITEEELQPITTRGENANVMAIVGGVAAGALLAAGVTLLVLGAKHRRKPNVASRARIEGAGSGIQLVF